MDTKKIIGVILILVGLFVGYTGVNKVKSNDAQVKVLGLKIDASNESGKNEGYMYLGLSALLIVGGFVTLNRK